MESEFPPAPAFVKKFLVPYVLYWPHRRVSGVSGSTTGSIEAHPIPALAVCTEVIPSSDSINLRILSIYFPSDLPFARIFTVTYIRHRKLMSEFSSLYTPNNVWSPSSLRCQDIFVPYLLYLPNRGVNNHLLHSTRR